jgi:hypothetical protein
MQITNWAPYFKVELQKEISVRDSQDVDLHKLILCRL